MACCGWSSGSSTPTGPPFVASPGAGSSCRAFVTSIPGRAWPGDQNLHIPTPSSEHPNLPPRAGISWTTSSQEAFRADSHAFPRSRGRLRRAARQSRPRERPAMDFDRAACQPLRSDDAGSVPSGARIPSRDAHGLHRDGHRREVRLGVGRTFGSRGIEPPISLFSVPRFTFPHVSGGVVVTGASSGIGAAIARDLAARGFRVFGTVRREQDGTPLEAAHVVPVLMDVTDAVSIARARDEVSRALAGAPLAGLVNNAGIPSAGPLEPGPLDQLRHVLEVNLVGAVAVTQAFLPLLKAARGRIVNISSVAGRGALPFMGPYAASKFERTSGGDARVV